MIYYLINAREKQMIRYLPILLEIYNINHILNGWTEIEDRNERETCEKTYYDYKYNY